MRYMIIILFLAGCGQSYEWIKEDSHLPEVQRQFGMDEFDCRKASTTTFPGTTSVVVNQGYTKQGFASGFAAGANAFTAAEAQRPKMVFNNHLYVSCMKGRGYSLGR